MSELHFSATALHGLLRTPAVRAGLAREAKKVAAHIEEQGIQVGAFSGGQGPIALPVRVTSADDSDRAVAFVTLAHPAGIAVQAKLGALTKGASAAGLSVRGD